MTTVAALPAVETPQLIVREIESQDWEAFSRYMTASRYQRFITIKLKSEAEVRTFVARSLNRQGDERRQICHLAAEGKREGCAIGDGFLIVQRKGLIEIGWGVDPNHWGRGLGSEISRVLVALAFERLNAVRIWAKVMSANEASLKVAKRAGLRHIQSHPDYPSGTGRFDPIDIFALTAKEYFELPY